ncbi:hypothetical protein OQH61_06990 [Helicobacter sp. MIT 21-1697]|uniref:hypothetical protein n=1 Tax=Helicobacter sp. MIT 21-1697 TaxID=2993733 RepID=UPI00224B35D3|nr:hypothetical protein [Helicobacter sp. MIT 21-1697]MCX2717476.1 hypothetical protein [Helicobacter sp. MIT 21-1697]
MLEIEYSLKANTREEIRKELVCLFLQEKSGWDFDEGKSTYKYIVERIEQYVIYLQRPAPLNKGFDFIVNVENMYFKLNDSRRHRNPSHKDIVYILMIYKQSFAREYSKIQELIKRIFLCENFNIAKEVQDLSPFVNYDGEAIPIAVILCCIKWLFIEQDVTYWNWSGRSMLFNHLQESGLVFDDC